MLGVVGAVGVVGVWREYLSVKTWLASLVPQWLRRLIVQLTCKELMLCLMLLALIYHRT